MTAGPLRPSWLPVAVGVVIGLSLAALLVGGIVGFTILGSAAPSTPSPEAVAAAPSNPVPSPAASARPIVSASATSAPSAPSTPMTPLVVDPALLSVLPASVGGLPVREFPEAEAQAITDPDLGRNVARLATAFVGDQGGVNWAYTAIVDVRPDAQTDAFYRDWQESFDASACERAGGVTGHTTVVIAGRDVERTACGAGVRTYHVRMKGTGLLLSISDLGDAKFGEQEIAALRP